MQTFPCKIFLGQSLKKSLPYVRKSVMTFYNPQISKMWLDVWSKNEESLSIPYVKSLKNLSEHTKSLPSLNCGDHVVIQNHTGYFPNKWAKTGVVVELKDYYQYVVDELGRLTFWNRKFLRKFNSLGCKSLGSINFLR